MRGYLLGGLFIVLTLTGCGSGSGEKVYKNPDFGYSVTYPAGWQAKPLKWVKEETGLELKKGDRSITIQALPTGLDYKNLPFDRYVRIAAAADIQNFTEPTLIEPFTSAYNIKGFKTYWKVTRHEDTDSGERDTTSIAGPLYYFPLARPRQLGDQPVKAVMIYADNGLSAEAAEIAESFRYLNSFVTLLRNEHHGKLFWAKKNRPFRIELAANPTTGYNWYITEMDEGRFQVRRSGYNAEATGLVGSGGVSYWEILPLKEGLGTIKLLYYRAWEGKERSVDRFQVRVVVL
ncbi:MAG TPA: protease inhibitor I42 family protein [Candidatus Sulfotelmatobacter sp.]|nr:protease inhibitor I42 family protein [Candidatus Sulfotelmatobacter sp.]